MPELPEVETIRKSLSETIIGKKIITVIINDSRVIKEPAASVFKKNIEDCQVSRVLRKAKVLVIGFSNGKYLIVHLRIAGWLLHGRRQDKARVVFELSDKTFLNYMDQRALGELRWVDDYKKFSLIERLGPEPFEISAGGFAGLIANKKTIIKNIIMNQEVISGIGNIYAQEALFLAGIHPCRPASSLNSQEIKKLHQKIIAVLNKAIKNKGSSIDLYRDVQGNKGTMQAKLFVYGRQGDLCLVCGRAIEKINLAGRGTCFCARCQK